MRPWAPFPLLVLAFAASVSAQTVEVTPIAGYRLGGNLSLVDDGDVLEVKDSWAWGVILGVTVAEDGELEALFARQGTRLASAGMFTSQPLFDLAIESYQLGGNYLFGDAGARLRPYVGVGLGVTRLVPEPAELESEIRFSASLAGGLKVFLARHLGLRFEVRGLFTVLESESDVFCGSQAGCLVRTQGSDLSQAELRGGLIFRF